MVVVGSSLDDNQMVDEARGTVRAFDAMTGAAKWSFDPVQGHNMRAGAANVWAPISADDARGLVYLPTSSPSPDFWGGYRTGDDWTEIGATLKRQVRKYLWNPGMQKYIPHLYLNGTPFPPALQEEKMLFTGGSACAILAGFNTKEEIGAINTQMRAAVGKEPFATVGMTVCPPYPDSVYPNMKAYDYQNGGDWTWFGGRMIIALAQKGFVKEAWEELQPMIARTLEYKGFYEWYDVKTGRPKGSGGFRGEAGVLYDAIGTLRRWAAAAGR